jgi:hypothetical protein
LDEVSLWFEEHVFAPLRTSNDNNSIRDMFIAVDEFFSSGKRICLMGSFALDNTRNLFSEKLNTYFTNWISALSIALKNYGYNTKTAKECAEDVVASIQGALVLARAQNNPKIFSRILKQTENILILNLYE